MILFKKVLALTLIVTMIHFYMPAQPRAQEDVQHTPQTWSTPEKELSKEEPKEKKSNLLWILLGLLVVGGGVAAVAGGSGGGGSGGSSSSDDEPKTGDYEFEW